MGAVSSYPTDPLDPTDFVLGSNAAGDVKRFAVADWPILNPNDDVEVDAMGNLRFNAALDSVVPGTDQLTFVPSRIAAGSGKVIPRFHGEDGTFKSMQDHLGRNTVVWAQARGNGTTALTPGTGQGLLSAVGTATTRNVTAGNRVQRAKRLGYVSVATAGAGTAGLYAVAASAQYTLGTAAAIPLGGFFHIWIFACSDAAPVAGAVQFVGMSSSVSGPSATQNPAVMTNVVGVAQITGSANLHIVYGGSAAQTPIDLGVNFPAADVTALYELMLYAPPNSTNKVGWRVENMSTGAVASGVVTGVAGTALPANTTLLGMRATRGNGPTTALAVGIDLVSYYIESGI